MSSLTVMLLPLLMFVHYFPGKDFPARECFSTPIF